MRPPEYDLPRRLARLEKVELHHHTTGGQEIRPGFAGSLDQMRPRGSHGIPMGSRWTISWSWEHRRYMADLPAMSQAKVEIVGFKALSLLFKYQTWYCIWLLNLVPY